MGKSYFKTSLTVDDNLAIIFVCTNILGKKLSLKERIIELNKEVVLVLAEGNLICK